MPATAALRPTPVNTTKGKKSKAAPGSGISFVGSISLRGSVPNSPLSPSLRQPDLLDSNDFAKVQERPASEQKFWRESYEEAYKAQAAQKLNWKVFEDRYLTGDNLRSDDIELLETLLGAHRDYFKRNKPFRDSLIEINNNINKKNKLAGVKLPLGHVIVAPIRKPRLAKVRFRSDTDEEDEDAEMDEDGMEERKAKEEKEHNDRHWTLISNEHPETLQRLAQFHSSGSALQIYRSRRMEVDPEEWNTEREVEWRELLLKQNKSLAAVTKKHYVEYQNLGEMHVPDVGGPAQILEGEETDLEEEESDDDSVHIEEASDQMKDGVRGNSGRDKVPENIQSIRAKMGGFDGPLQRYLLTKDVSAKRELDAIHKEMKSAAQMEKFSSLDILNFHINLPALEAFYSTVTGSRAIYTDVVAEPVDAKVAAKYRSYRKQAEEYVFERDYPESLVDALVPSLAILKELSKRYKLPKDTETSPDMEKEILKIRSVIEGKAGPLNKYLYSLIQGGKVDNKAKKLIGLTNAKIAHACNDRKISDIYSIGQDALDSMRIWVADLENLRQTCLDSPGDQAHLEALGGLIAEIYTRSEGSLGVAKALLGDSEELYEELVEKFPLKPSRKNKRQRKKKASEEMETDDDAVDVPPADNSEDQFISSGARPGLVEGKIGENNVMMRIMGRRRVGYGHQLLVKYMIKPFKFPAFKLVPESTYKGAWEGCNKLPNGQPKFVVGKRSDLSDVEWLEMKIGGVASIERDEFDAYIRHAVTLILVKIPGEKEKWYPQSDLRSRFGDQIDAFVSKYVKKTGQSTPKTPWKWSKTKALILAEENKQRFPGKNTKENRNARSKMIKNKMRAADQHQRSRHNESDDEGDSTSDTESEYEEDILPNESDEEFLNDEDESTPDNNEESDDEIEKLKAKLKMLKEKKMKQKSRAQNSR